MTIQVASKPTLSTTFENQIHINLGIDFGTSFTKVCYRDLGAEESIVARIGLGSSVVPSVVAVNSCGRLHLGDTIGKAQSDYRISYLKMRIAGEQIEPKPPLVCEFDLGSCLGQRALSAWFLASIMNRSKDWIGKIDSDRLRNRDPIWSANIGVPVDHFDSKRMPAFKEVFRVAWKWAFGVSRLPERVGQLKDSYCDTRDSIYHSENANPDLIDCRAVPEIAAAIYPFVMSRDAAPGMYAHFDIGGGTLDGVVFEFRSHGADKRILCYSGKVGRLGIAIVSERLELDHYTFGNPSSFDEQIMYKCHNANTEVQNIQNEINRLVGNVIWNAARKKRTMRFSREASEQRPGLPKNPRDQDNVLHMFLGGGGSLSSWYCSAIKSTHEKFRQGNAGIPLYDLQPLRAPTDLLGVPNDEDTFRHAVSYGLSIPYDEGPKVTFPSKIGQPPPLPKRKPVSGVSYGDTKDVYE